MCEQEKVIHSGGVNENQGRKYYASSERRHYRRQDYLGQITNTAVTVISSEKRQTRMIKSKKMDS